MLASTNTKPVAFPFSRDKRQQDDKGYTLMTLPYLKQLCKEQKGYATPELNDRLYLHYKGFARIENLESYTGLKSLWLEGNGITEIEGLDELKELRCLYLQENCISKIKNVTPLVNLDTLNLSNNMIKCLDPCLATLPQLKSLLLTKNQLKGKDDLEVLKNCAEITVLDLSHNKLEDPEIYDIFADMPNLAVLNLMGNPIVPKTKQYRRTLIHRCKKLTYLDDRPVFDSERRAVEAWAEGGMEAEREERSRQREEEREEHRRNFEALRQLQAENQQRRRETYGSDVDDEPTYPPNIQRFHDEMVSRVDDTDPTETVENGRTERLKIESDSNISVAAEDYGRKTLDQGQNECSNVGQTDEKLTSPNEMTVPIRNYVSLTTTGRLLTTRSESPKGVANRQPKIQEIVETEQTDGPNFEENDELDVSDEECDLSDATALTLDDKLKLNLTEGHQGQSEEEGGSEKEEVRNKDLLMAIRSSTRFEKHDMTETTAGHTEYDIVDQPLTGKPANDEEEFGKRKVLIEEINEEVKDASPQLNKDRHDLKPEQDESVQEIKFIEILHPDDDTGGEERNESEGNGKVAWVKK
ncbi:hypothetical protein BKA69DRAFT_1089989 [Paraphysoderma sedebokerense]|nr:hypothetical protein BKA69DRAFT_1089989 [Paraphysoderma sedebokerense]